MLIELFYIVSFLFLGYTAFERRDLLQFIIYLSLIILAYAVTSMIVFIAITLYFIVDTIFDLFKEVKKVRKELDDGIK